jgi:hypothetical protein
MLTDVEKTYAIKSSHELWTHNLLDHFLKIVSNNFSPSHMNALQAYVKVKMGDNKLIMEIL